MVLCLGEAASMSGEAASRANPCLPGAQNALAEAIFDLGKPVVVLMSSGRPLMIGTIAAKAQALVATWFLGVEAGHAIADVLTGTIQSDRPAAGHLAPRCRPSADILRRAAKRETRPRG